MRKVLIAEDSNVVKNLTKNILEDQGFEVYGARNGEEVLILLKKAVFDIILMDIHMPVMDGLECSKRIRASKNKKVNSVPIIAFTGNFLNYTQEDFEANGINDYVVKPVDYDDLLQKMINLLGAEP